MWRKPTIFININSTINKKNLKFLWKKTQIVQPFLYIHIFCYFAWMLYILLMIKHVLHVCLHWRFSKLDLCGGELYSHFPCCLAGWLAACHVLCVCVYVRAGVVENVNDVWAVSWAGRKLSGGVAWVTLLSINRPCMHGGQTDRQTDSQAA